MKEQLKTWLHVILFLIVMISISLLTSCGESRDNRFNRLHPEFKGVILSGYDSQMSITEHGNVKSINTVTFRIKDLERNVVVLRHFPIGSINASYLEGDTIILRR